MNCWCVSFPLSGASPSYICCLFLVLYECFNNAIHSPHLSRVTTPPDSSHDWPPRSLDKLPSFQTFVYPYILLMHLLPAISGDDLLLISMSGLVHQGANFTPAVHHAPACRLTVVRHMVTESLNLKLLLWCPAQVASLKTIRGISRGLLSVLIG